MERGWRVGNWMEGWFRKSRPRSRTRLMRIFSYYSIVFFAGQMCLKGLKTLLWNFPSKFQRIQRMLPSMETAYIYSIRLEFIFFTLTISLQESLYNLIAIRTNFESFVKPRNVRLFDSRYKSRLKNFATGYLLLWRGTRATLENPYLDMKSLLGGRRAVAASREKNRKNYRAERVFVNKTLGIKKRNVGWERV